MIGYNGDDLQHAELEAAAIANMIKGETLIEQDATHDAVQSKVIDQKIIHFACHGQFNPARPLVSYLALADGPLYVTDILRRFDLQANLVVLSACETGRSHVRRGDELIGFMRAFFYAGTPSVVVSLWPVDEVSTRLLMEFFYSELLAGRTKGDALRCAQRRLRSMTEDELVAILHRLGVVNPEQEISSLRTLVGDKPIFSHPYFWAPFFLVGATN